METITWRWVLGWLGKGVVALASVPSWLLAAYLMAWFWPGAKHGQTCDLVHQDWCKPGWGMPQYVTMAVLLGLSSLLLATAAVSALIRRGPRGMWLAACVCALLAGAAVTILPALLKPHAPQWWFAL